MVFHLGPALAVVVDDAPKELVWFPAISILRFSMRVSPIIKAGPLTWPCKCRDHDDQPLVFFSKVIYLNYAADSPILEL